MRQGLLPILQMRKPTERLSSLSKVTQLAWNWGVNPGSLDLSSMLCFLTTLLLFGSFLQESPTGTLGTSPEIPTTRAGSSTSGLTFDTSKSHSHLPFLC